MRLAILSDIHGNVLALDAVLADLAARGGADAVVMEVSSHALALGRTAGLRFAVAAFTNFGSDHLDFHGDVASYFAAKASLFTADRAEAAVINVDDARRPRVVSNLRLAVHQPKARLGAQGQDPGASSLVGGYAAHYCSAPREVDPGIVACSMILSGLRVFDVRDPLRPREVAYFNKPVAGGAGA